VDAVTFGLLGPVEVGVPGRPPVALPPSVRALLARLALKPGRVVSVDTLTDALWGENLPADAANALQIRVSKLRRSLAASGLRDLVVRHGTGYRADTSPESVDAVAFAAAVGRARAAVAGVLHPGEEHLARYDEALALWRGEPLSDFANEPWATVEAGRLTELRLAALTERSQVALGLGRALEVVADLEPLVAADPTLESLAGLLMVALYRAGRQADSLDVYQRTRTLLDDSLGLEPSVTLRSLHERVLRQDAALGAPADLAPPSVPAPRHRPQEEPTPVATSLPTVARPLVGRDEQLADLARLVGRTRLVTLVGPGGAGKTSLALAVAAGVADRFPDGVHGVRLASVSAPEQVALAVAEAVGVPLDGAATDRDLRSRLVTFLAGRRAFLLVDNCEHVVDAVAALVDDVVARCPQVTVLATSREALAVPDEVQVTVGAAEGTGVAPGPFLAKEIRVLEDFGRRFGPYPWPTLTMAITPELGGGIEFPAHIQQGPGTIGRTTSHEVGHEWFYALVGNDQGRDPWLDEGLASYAEARFENTLAAFRSKSIPADAQGRTMAPMTYWEPRQSSYYRGVYVQGAVAVAATGDPALVDCALRIYVARNAFRIARPRDLVDALTAVFPDAPSTLAPYGVRG
jgi:DNA-binding SARP family transcriptional activator